MNSASVIKIFDSLSVGVAVVDFNQRVVGANRTFRDWFAARKKRGVSSTFGIAGVASQTSGESSTDDDLKGRLFYQTLDFPQILDGDFCPLHYVRTEKRVANALVVDRRTNVRYELSVSPFFLEGVGDVCLAEIKKIGKANDAERMLSTLRKAGGELTAFSERDLEAPKEVRARLLRERVQKHMIETLKYDVFEIRLLNRATGELEPFLAFGMGTEAKNHRLFASANGNGVIGYVASSGETYFCDDTQNDYLYIAGAIDARSSLTIPILSDGDSQDARTVVGVCNVESQTPSAFTKRDAEFLQIYMKDLALAIQTLKLISIESDYARRFCGEQLRDKLYEEAEEACSRAFSLLDDAERLASDPVGDRRVLGAEFVEATRQTARLVLELKTKINRVKKDYLNAKTPSDGETPEERNVRAALENRRVLVVESKRDVARQIVDKLEAFNCDVDSVFETKAALQLLRTQSYDLVVSSLFPDGPYSVATADVNRRNAFGRSVYDVHLENYEVPFDDDPVDAATRRQVRREICVERKLDAYFFKVAIDALALEKSPAFAASASPLDYDPTHVLRDLNSLQENAGKPKTVVFSELSLNSMPKQLAEALNRENADASESRR